VTQAKLQQRTGDVIQDAKAPLDGGRWGFAYYVIGYAVEFSLKSCVLARMIHTGWVFLDHEKGEADCKTHDFPRLIKFAGLLDDLNNRLKESVRVEDAFVRNWDIVKAWKVDSRYDPKTEVDARKLYCAITDEPDGVLKWIRNYW
jgi:hypothetical protein